MGAQVVMGAMVKCSFGETPVALVVTPSDPPVTAGTPAATIMDFVPIDNIATFGMCNTITNPEVAAATAAKAGAFTPAPCVPATSSPWIPGVPTVLINDQPALSSDCTCLCDYGGVITVEDPGQVIVTLPG
jgi:hypothetical protein